MLGIFLAGDGIFDAADASNFRCQQEFAGMLEILANRLPDVYYQQILASRIAEYVSNSPSLAEAFRSARTGKDFEACFKALIEHNRQQ